MMKAHIYFKILIVTLFLGATISCIQEDVIYNNDNNTNVAITLTLGKEASYGSRADTEDGVTDLNENLMKTVQLFFYKNGAELDENAVFHSDIIPLGTKGAGVQSSATGLSVEIPKTTLETLFPKNDVKQCKVYAIVNLPSASDNDPNVLVDHELPEDNDMSIASLKDKVTLYAPSFYSNNGPTKQSSFVMVGEALLDYDGKELKGTINVERVASKVSLIIDGISTVYEYEKDDEGNDTETVVAQWVPNSDNMKVSMRRGSLRAKLGSGSKTERKNYIYVTENINDDIFEMNDVALTNRGVGENSSWETDIPFYTYPADWEENEDVHIHFILSVEWQKQIKNNNAENTFIDDGEPFRAYYEVNVNPNGSYTLRNTHYKITQEISVVGSTDIAEPLPLNPSYQVLDWGVTTESEASLNRFRYLVVDETAVTMNNTDTKTIYFNTSDPVKLTQVEVYWNYTKPVIDKNVLMVRSTNPTHDNNGIYTISNTSPINNADTGNQNVTNRIQERTYDDGTISRSFDGKVYITLHNATETNPQNYIVIKHNLDNSGDKYSDYSKYTMTITIAHVDGEYQETINITQYPMISIETDLNSNCTNKENINSSDNNNKKGYVYVNNDQAEDGGIWGGSLWYGVSGMTQTKNPNRYIISISALDASSDYIIGDPRSKEVENPVRTTNKDIEVDDKERSITYYYPTASNTGSMIAPQFMFASSYGACTMTKLSYQQAEARCATYQEDGYPAGRWRVPTQAEIMYVTQLSAWEMIPALFSSGFAYWSAQGCVTPNNDTGTVTSSNNTTALVRCVYDTWRWGTGQLENRETFVYGDVERR